MLTHGFNQTLSTSLATRMQEWWCPLLHNISQKVILKSSLYCSERAPCLVLFPAPVICLPDPVSWKVLDLGLKFLSVPLFFSADECSVLQEMKECIIHWSISRHVISSTRISKPENSPSLLTVSLYMQGYIVGNPVTGDKVDTNSQIPYAHSHGIISDQQYEVALLFIQIHLPTWTTTD